MYYAFWDKAGSPLTGHNRRFDRDGRVQRITENERYGLTIPESIRINDNGTLYTRMLIHSPYLCYIGENGLTSLEYGVMLKEKLNIAVLLIYPFEWKERIEKLGSIADYNEILCQQSEEKETENWLYLFEYKKLVYNIYLDFLKAVPISYSPYFSPFKWIKATKSLRSDIPKSIGRFFQSKEERIQLKPFLPFITDNVIDFEKLKKILDFVSDERWQEWEKEHQWRYSTLQKAFPSLAEKNSRIDIIKIFFCSLAFWENIPDDVIRDLLKFHHLL